MVVNYQKVEVGGVIYINGIDRMAEYRNIFPCLPIGKRILDVGCFNGFYLMQANLEGAAYGFGIEKDRRRFARGMDAIKKIGMKNVTLVNEDILTMEIKEKFDISLCLNLLHHFRIEQAREIVRKIGMVTTEKIFFVIVPAPPGKEWDIVRVNKRKWLGLSEDFFRSELGGYYLISSKPTVIEPKDRVVITATRAMIL